MDARQLYEFYNNTITCDTIKGYIFFDKNNNSNSIAFPPIVF